MSWVNGIDETGVGIPTDEGEIGYAARLALKLIGTRKAIVALAAAKKSD